MSYTPEEIRELLERYEQALRRRERALAVTGASDDLAIEHDARTGRFSAADRDTVGHYLEELVAATTYD